MRGWLRGSQTEEIRHVDLDCHKLYNSHNINIIPFISPSPRFQPFDLSSCQGKIFFWQRVKWITHLSLAISDRSCCIFWLSRGDFSLPGLAMPNSPMICCWTGSWVCGEGSLPCSSQAVATNPAKGVIHKFSARALGEADS